LSEKEVKQIEEKISVSIEEEEEEEIKKTKEEKTKYKICQTIEIKKTQT
jgi:hypothetical protein